jgi:hypothetical protein
LQGSNLAPLGGELFLGALHFVNKFLKGHDLKNPVFGIFHGFVTNAAVPFLPSDGGIKALGVNPSVGTRSARTKELPIRGAAPKPDPLVAIQTLDPDAPREPCLSQSVECCLVFLSGKPDKRLDVLAGVPASPPVGSNARNQDARGCVEAISANGLWLVGTFGHHATLPVTRLPRGGRSGDETSRVGQGRRSRPEGQP